MRAESYKYEWSSSLLLYGSSCNSFVNFIGTGLSNKFTFIDAIDPDYFEKYVQDEGISQDKKQEIYNKLDAARKRIRQRSYVNLPKTGYERTKELEDLYGFDFRPNWMKRSAFN